MELDADSYNQKNHLQYGHAEELINKIKESIDKKFDVVLDVGCGSGNITFLLNTRLSISQLYAIDIDEKMIKFAKENHQKNNIQYIVQDLTQDWDHWSPKLKALEGKVSLIFSNYVLHWIMDRENTAKNLFRLLSKGGRFYANFVEVYELFTDLTGKEKEIHEKEVLKVPPKEEQLDIWIKSFKNAGLLINAYEFIETKTIFDEQTFKQIMLQIILLMQKQYLVEKNEQKRNEVLNQISDSIFKRVYDMSRKFIDRTTGKTMIELPYTFFRIVLQK